MDKAEKKHKPIVFWAHFTGSNKESDRMERFWDGRDKSEIIFWVRDQRKLLEEANGCNYVMVNCGVI